MEKLANKFLSLNVNLNKNYEEEYVTNNKDFNIEILKNKLIDYRRKKSAEKKIPAYYVFNNEELEKILDTLPKSLQELKEQDILSEIKIKLHGNEIIKIINSI